MHNFRWLIFTLFFSQVLGNGKTLCNPIEVNAQNNGNAVWSLSVDGDTVTITGTFTAAVGDDVSTKWFGVGFHQNASGIDPQMLGANAFISYPECEYDERILTKPTTVITFDPMLPGSFYHGSAFPPNSNGLNQTFCDETGTTRTVIFTRDRNGTEPGSINFPADPSDLFDNGFGIPIIGAIGPSDTNDPFQYHGIGECDVSPICCKAPVASDDINKCDEVQVIDAFAGSIGINSKIPNGARKCKFYDEMNENIISITPSGLRNDTCELDYSNGYVNGHTFKVEICATNNGMAYTHAMINCQSNGIIDEGYYLAIIKGSKNKNVNIIGDNIRFKLIDPLTGRKPKYTNLDRDVAVQFRIHERSNYQVECY